MGMVKNFTNNGNGTGSVVLQNMGGNTPSSGDTLVGDSSGNSLVLTSFDRSSLYDDEDTVPDYSSVMNNTITDEYGVIAMPEHFTGDSIQDYQTEYIITQ
jgi:hypothetical protein